MRHDPLADVTGRGRNDDQHLVRPPLAEERGKLGGRTENPYSVQPQVLLAGVVVDEPDRRVAEGRVAQHLAEHQLGRVTGADEKNLPATSDDRSGRGPLDERPREQPNSHREREQEEQVDDPDPARHLRRVKVEEREDEEGRDHRHGDAAQHSPHVLRRDVPPPAVVEAEGDEDGQRDPDHERDDIPLEVAVVVARPVRVEADVPRDDPRCGDQGRVDRDLPQAVAVHGRAHAYAATRATERTASTTRSCCSRSMPPHIGRARFSAAARSVSGSDPSATPRYASAGWRWSGVT